MKTIFLSHILRNITYNFMVQLKFYNERGPQFGVSPNRTEKTDSYP